MKNCFYAFILLFLFFFILFLKNEKRVPFNIIFSTKEDVEELNNPAGNPLITSIFLLQLANMKNQYFVIVYLPYNLYGISRDHTQKDHFWPFGLNICMI